MGTHDTGMHGTGTHEGDAHGSDTHRCGGTQVRHDATDPDGTTLRRAVAVVAGLVFAATLVTLNAGRGRVELALGDLILSAATGAVMAGLVVVGLTVRDELRRPSGR